MILLKIQWELLGLKAPAFSWVVSACLIVYSIYIYGTHLRASRNRQRVLGLAERRLSSLRGPTSTRPGEGVERSTYDSIASIFDGLPLLQPCWRAIASCVVITDRDSGGRFWVSEDIDQIMAGTSVVDHHSYRTAATVISGVGLLATFLAILVALLDVRLSQNRVQGIDLLVQGLSGKFLSSVVAVACATVLIQVEKALFRPVLSGMVRLSAEFKNALPRLVPAQIMSDLRSDMLAQFGAFNFDLQGAVKAGMGESLKSAVIALERMATLQDELNRFVRENEAQKQEAMNEQLKTTLQEFGQSLGASLDRMGAKFDEALALNTQGHFVHISESLSSASAHLQEVNEQLVTNQYVLIDLVELARATTTAEAEARKAQNEHLAGTVSDLMSKLQEKTAEAMLTVDSTVAAMTVNVSDKVMELSTEMATVIRETSERSTNKAKEVMENVTDKVVKIVELSRAATTAETEARKAQNEHLAGTVSDLMSKLQEKTAEAMLTVDSTVAAMTVNVSDKVMELSTEMATVIRETSERSTNKAKEVMEQAGALSSQAAAHLAGLLERHGSELTKVEELKDMLDETIRGFLTSIDKYGHVTDGLQQVTAQVNVGVTSLGQAARSVKEGQEAAARVSSFLAEQIESMKGVIQNHGEVWDGIRESMVEYEKIFGVVEGQAGEMLSQIARHLKTYSDATEKHFSNLALTADSLVAQATGRLSGSIKLLSEQLDDLHTTIGGLSRLSQARA